MRGDSTDSIPVLSNKRDRGGVVIKGGWLDMSVSIMVWRMK